jgi:ASC-1-like (ASCH) protein
MEYKKHVSEPWFSFIQQGLKTCEGRLQKGDFLHIQVGDTIIFSHDTRSIRVQVLSLSHYSNFEHYLIHETLADCLPGVTSIQEGLDVYHQFFTEREECLYGVLAIRFRILEDGV